MLGDGHERGDAAAVEIQQQFVHVQDQRIFFRHGGLIAVDAVDHHGLDPALIHAAPHAVRELAGGQLGRVDLLDQQVAGGLQRGEVDAHVFHALEEQAQFLIEDEQRGFFAPRHGGGGKHHRDQRLAGAGGAEDQAAGAGLDSAAHQGIHFANAAAQGLAHIAAAMLGRHQPREHMHAIAHDGEIVEAAAVLLAAVLHDPHATAFGAVIGRQFFQANHPVGDAVYGFVEGFGGQVVEQQHRGVVAHEIVLDRQDLSSITQGTLRQQADFGEAVDHHAGRLDPFHHFKDLPRGLAQLQVGRVQQALLLFGIEQAFRRGQLENMDIVIQIPAVGFCALAQFTLGFGQGDIERAFTIFCPCLQEVQGDGGFAGPWFAFEQKQMAAGQTAAKNVIKTFDTGGRLFG